MIRSTLMWSLALTLVASPATGKQFGLPHIASPDALHRTTALAARPFVDEAVWPARTEELPTNIAVPDTLRDIAAAMLRTSSTFRRQCARLASAPDLIVTVDHAQPPGANPYAATTAVHRRGDGRLVAEVHIASGGNRQELLAHEFEHIIEQLDGIDLAALARRPGTGVHVVPNATVFETDRAVMVGRQVVSEMRAVRGT